MGIYFNYFIRISIKNKVKDAIVSADEEMIPRPDYQMVLIFKCFRAIGNRFLDTTGTDPREPVGNAAFIGET